MNSSSRALVSRDLLWQGFEVFFTFPTKAYGSCCFVVNARRVCRGATSIAIALSSPLFCFCSLPPSAPFYSRFSYALSLFTPLSLSRSLSVSPSPSSAYVSIVLSLSRRLQRLEQKYISASGLPPASGSGPLCFMDIEVGGQPVGRLVFHLFADKTPKAAENFRALCTGEKVSATRECKKQAGCSPPLPPPLTPPLPPRPPPGPPNDEYRRRLLADGEGALDTYMNTQIASSIKKLPELAWFGGWDPSVVDIKA